MILQLGKYYPPHRGGIESVTQSLSLFLSQEVSQVVCVVFDNTIKKTVVECQESIKIIRCPTQFTLLSQPFSIHYIIQSLKYLKASKVVHVHWPNFLTLAPLILNLFRNPKVLLHWHADHSGSFLVNVFTSPLIYILSLLTHRAVFTSPDYAKGSYFRFFFKKKSIVIPLSVPLQETSRNISQMSFSKLRFLSVGRFVRYKNYSNYITALAELRIEEPNLFSRVESITICGAGPLLNDISKLVRILKLDDCVEIRSNLSGLDLQALYESSNMFVLPSSTKAEAFGVVLLEAKQKALPCIAVNIPNSGVPWVADTGGKSMPIAKSGSVNDLKLVLKKAFNIKETELEDIAQNSRDDYLERFSPDLEQSNWLKIYKSCF